MYIADRENHRIRMVSASTGIISTIAGDGNDGYYNVDDNNDDGDDSDDDGDDSNDDGDGYIGDGGPATSATLNFPFAIALDSSGRLPHVAFLT